jgi:cobalamin biosynthesis protein CobT
MNRDIQLLREVITKLVPLLTGKGLKVTQRGTQAYVQANPKTNKPEVVNIPSIPDNASDDFIAAVAGFVDHEVAHVLFTDWKFYGGDGVALDKFSPEGRALTNTHNIIEDTMIEREVVKTFPGSEHNLDRLHRHFIAKITTPAVASAKGDENTEFAYLVVPMMRALSGQDIFQEFMDQNNHWKHPLIENLLMAMSDDALTLLKKARTTQETLEVAQEIHDILFHNRKKDGTPAQKQPEPPKQGKSQDKPEQQAGSGNGDGARKHDEDGEDENTAGDQPGTSQKGDDAKDETEDDADAGAGGAGAGGDDETEDDAGQSSAGGDAGEGDDGEDDAEAAGAGAGDDEADEAEDEAAGGKGDDEDDEQGSGAAADEEGEPEAEDEAEASSEGEDEDGENAEAGDEGDDESDEYEDHEGNEDGSDAESTPGGAGGVGGDAGKSLFKLDPATFKPLDLSSAIANEIQQMAQKAVNAAPYSVFTKDEDEIKTLDVPESAFRDEWVPKLDEAVMSMVGPMQKDIERLMAAQSLSVRTAGHKSGRLHSASLYRVMQGDPRVFQRKEEHRSKDTAVMLLVDQSGSMMGSRIVVAMQSAYALAQTLERVNIPSEIIGFTTGSMSSAARQQAYDEYKKHGVQFDRDSHTVVMPIYKTFNERLSPTVKKRIAFQLNVQAGMNTNTDGESLEYAAMRLIPRREKRKVMLVLSDGQPVGSGSGAHLKATVTGLTKTGIETVGIGIQSDAVKHFYPRYLTLNNVTDLPAIVMGELKRILTN